MNALTPRSGLPSRIVPIVGHAATAYIVLAVGVVISAAIAYWTATLVEREAKQRFEYEILNASDEIEARINAYSDVLLGVRALFLASESVTRSEFRDYVASLDLKRRYPGLRVVHYAQHVTPAQKAAFEAGVRKDKSVDAHGYPDFSTKPPGERAEYVVVQYVEPLAGNENVLGLDLAGDAARLAVLARARDTGQTIASGPVEQGLEPARRPGLAVRLPVYRRGMPTETQAQRRLALEGVVSASFVLIDIMRGALHEQFLQNIHLRIHDAGFAHLPPLPASADNLMFDSHRLAPAPAPDVFLPWLNRETELDLGGRRWKLQFEARESFVAFADRWRAPVAFFAGLTISILMFGLIRSLATTGRRAVALADTITEDLRRSEANLAAAQRATQELIEVLPVPIFFKGTDGRYLGVNRAWEKFFGVSRSEFVGKTVHELYPAAPEVAARLHAMDQALWDKPGTQSYETTIATPAGRRHDTIYYKATFTDAQGKVAGLIGTIIDITERKQAEAAMKESEELYRATFDQAAVGIVHTSLDGRYLKVNHTFCEMLGYSEQELLGRAVIDFTHPEDRDSGRQYRDLLWQRKLDKYSGEKRYVRKDGSVIWTNRTVSLARDPHDQPMYFIRVIEDVTDRKEVEERYRATFDNAPVGIMHTTVEGYRILRANRKLCEMLGYTQEELLSMTSTDIVHPDYRFTDRSRYQDQLLKDEVPAFLSERKFLRKDGSSIWVNRTVSLVHDANGEPLYFIRIIEDITERKLAEQRQTMEHRVTRLLSQTDSLDEIIPGVLQTIGETLNCACGACWLWDEEKKTRVCADTWSVFSPEIAEFLATNRRPRGLPRTAGGLINRAWDSGEPVWISDVSADPTFRRGQRAAAAGLNGAFAFPIRSGDDVLGVMEFYTRDRRPVDELLMRSARSLGSQIGQFVARSKAEERVRHLAHFDELTGLPNRNTFNQRLQHALAQAHRHAKPLAVLFIDLDRFKVINDTLGHDAGDRVLRDVAQRFGECLRDSDTVARLGGDEFVVLIEELPDPVHVTAIAQKILAAVAKPFVLDGQEFQVTASIGITTYPDDSEDMATLLKNADIAMYRAKEQGKNIYQFYSAQMNVHSLERLALESNLRRAVERDEFRLHYQPKVHLASGRITGMEALVRWQQPGKALIYPAEFIPLAEETGFIVPIGEWVMKTACAQNKFWEDRGLPPLRVAVNLSPRQFTHEKLLDDVARILAETGLDPARLEFEITESMVMHNAEHAVKLLNRLSAMGIHLSIDDFGTGYSSLSYLKRFPIDSVKIDRSFIRDIPGDADDAAITQAIIAMAHGLHITVIAEGVETREQLEFLRAHGCDEIQGHYFSNAVPPDEFVRRLEEHAGSNAAIAAL